jgi:hypothetical protein
MKPGRAVLAKASSILTDHPTYVCVCVSFTFLSGKDFNCLVTFSVQIKRVTIQASLLRFFTQ